MTSPFFPGVLDRRILRNIRFNARRLASQEALPGMDTGDIEQDLIADLLRRSGSFDHERSAYPTFADRIINNRVAALTRPVEKLKGDRQWTPLHTIGGDEAASLLETLPIDEPPLDDQVGIRRDVGRFLGGLPLSLLICCDILLADSITAGALQAGVHRSSFYERLDRLRRLAAGVGLGAYVGLPDTSRPRRVSGDRPFAARRMQFLAARSFKPVYLSIDAAGLRRWLDEAQPGDNLIYYRGFVAFDVVPYGSRLSEDDRAELIRVASLARAASDLRQACLVQKRHGDGDYSYVLVRRASLPADRRAEKVLS